MNELVIINKTTSGKEWVSARDIYEKLGYDLSNWAKWYKKNLVDNEFAIEHTDYEPLVLSTNGSEGIFAQDFLLSIHFAKRICMLSKTDIGDQIRKYFIECEKKALEKRSVFNIQDIVGKEEVLIELIRAYKEQRLLAESNAIDAKYTKEVLLSDSAITATNISKELGFKSAQQMNLYLAFHHIQWKHQKTWLLYAEYSSKGYMTTVTYLDKHGKSHIESRWTETGRQFLHNFIQRHPIT